MKLGLVAAGLILVAGGAVGCGDDGGDDGGDGGKTASKDDFCAAFQAFDDDLKDVGEDTENLGKILKDAAKKIEDAGTPKGIPADAKEGLELTLDAIDGLPDDATSDDIAALQDDLSDADKKKSDAFTAYLDETCPDLGA